MEFPWVGVPSGLCRKIANDMFGRKATAFLIYLCRAEGLPHWKDRHRPDRSDHLSGEMWVFSMKSATILSSLISSHGQGGNLDKIPWWGSLLCRPWEQIGLAFLSTLPQAPTLIRMDFRGIAAKLRSRFAVFQFLHTAESPGRSDLSKFSLIDKAG